MEISISGIILEKILIFLTIKKHVLMNKHK